MRGVKFEDGTDMFDYSLTVLAAFIATKYTKIPLVLTTILMFLVGIIFHLALRVDTVSIKYLRTKFG